MQVSCLDLVLLILSQKHAATFVLTSCMSSVQFNHSVVSDSFWPHGLQRAMPPCPSPTPGVYWDSCPLSRWCHPTISCSVVPFSSRLQSFPASGSFQMSQLFASGSQSIGASASVLPVSIQDWFSLGLAGWISLQSKRLKSLLPHHCSKASILWRSAFLYVLTLLYLNICLHWSLRMCFTSLEKRGPLRMFWLCSVVCKDFERVVQGRSYCNYYNLIACSCWHPAFLEAKI